MKIVADYPPNIDEIRKVLTPPEQAVFTYGDTIYAPHNTDLPAHLVHHEEVHMKQQSTDVDKWWTRYLSDPEFRLSQEVEAYQAQYAYIRVHCNREERRHLLSHIIGSLSGEMYGRVVSKELAKELITRVER